MLRHFLAVLVVGPLALATSAIACTSASGDTRDGGADSTTDAPSKDSGVDSPGDASAGDAGVFLVELAIRPDSDALPPLTLVPPFSPDVHDYYVRCEAGLNTLSISMVASTGALSALLRPTASHSMPKETVSPVRVAENQAIVAAATRGSLTVEYWIRCLPHDFPEMEWDPHPEAGTPSAGYYLVGTYVPLGSHEGGYAIVLNSDGVPVWYYNETTGGVCDVDGVVTGAVSFIPVAGGDFQVHQLSPPSLMEVAPAGVPLDEHELRVLPNGDYLVFSNPNEGGFDLTGLHLTLGDGGTQALGPGSNINECNIVEFNPMTGAVVWTWSATDHFDPAKDSIEPIFAPPLPDGGVVIDPFHCNSIDVDEPSGNLLVSARQMNSVFYVERPSGTVSWKMGGAHASIDDAEYIPVEDPFYGQHDARLQPGWSTCGGGQISLFDDETYGMGEPARGVLYDVTLGAKDGGCDGGSEGGVAGANVAWKYVGAATSRAAGSVRTQPDGSRVVGWGLQPAVAFTELDEKGNDLLDFHFVNNQSYRAVKVPLGALSLDAMRASAGQSP
jgi:hypothetical protein